jgi:hypothetical protein
MAQVTAGETITLTIEGKSVSVKIEDASKSDTILGKVESSGAERYRPGQVYEFDRALLSG